MKLSTALLPLALASVALAAPVTVEAREADPAPGYGSYGSYPPPAGLLPVSTS